MSELTEQQDVGLKTLFEENKAKTYEQMRDAAECLKEDEFDKMEVILKDIAYAKLNPAKTDAILKLIKKAKFSTTTAREMLKDIRMSGSVKAEDVATKIVRLTLDRFYMGGDYLTMSETGHFWEYIGTHWVRRSDNQIGNKVQQVVRSSISPEAGAFPYLEASALAALKRDRTPDQDVFQFNSEPKPVINCRNCELWIMSDGSVVQRPHSPRSYLTYCLEFDYDPAAECPIYDEMLLGIFAKAEDPPAMVRHWNEFFGYAIQPKRDIASFWMLIGSGHNGKTSLSQLLMRLLGPSSVASAKVGTLDGQFGLSPLLGKLVMIDDDVDSYTKLPDGTLKQISESKDVSVEFKGQTPFQAKLTVVPVLLCNNLPMTGDVSEGIRRRARVIKFSRHFSDEERDGTLVDRITAGEMSGVLNRALAGLQRLRQRGNFLVPAECEEAANAWIVAANPLKGFIDECIEEGGPNLLITKFYATFEIWAKENGVKHMVTRNKMKATLESMNYQTSQTHSLATWTGHRFNGRGLDLYSKTEMAAREARTDSWKDFSRA
jgi:putative DNA primase/helicase